MTGWGSAFAGLPFGEPSPGVLDGVLARIAAVDGDLSAFVAIDADRPRHAVSVAVSREPVVLRAVPRPSELPLI